LSAEDLAALRGHDVTAGYGGDPVITGLSVRADQGQVVSVVGPNGSGKSTLLNLLAEHVRQLAEHGAAVLIVEQRARAVLEVSDLTYVMGGGELRMQGAPVELAASPEFMASFLGGRPGAGTGPL